MSPSRKTVRQLVAIGSILALVSACSTRTITETVTVTVTERAAAPSVPPIPLAIQANIVIGLDRIKPSLIQAKVNDETLKRARNVCRAYLSGLSGDQLSQYAVSEFIDDDTPIISPAMGDAIVKVVIDPDWCAIQ